MLDREATSTYPRGETCADRAGSGGDGPLGTTAEAIGPDPAALIRRDQLEASRRSVLIAIPVNMLLGLAGTIVAIHAGNGVAGGIWLAASTGANLLRIALCRASCRGLALDGATPAPMVEPLSRNVDRHLRLASACALLSGLVWALLPALCEGYTSAQTLFYLTVTCGITAGAVTHGTAYARIPLCFITAPLLSVAGCLLLVGGFERICLAATVLLYLAALTKSALESEAAFRRASRLKNEATALAQSREAAHARASALADEMRQRATHDVLTGVLNRAGLIQEAEALLGREEAPCCLLLLDLDGFKSVNDVYGHTTGDRVLVEVARRLRAALPPSGLLARLGGDEFAIVYDSTLSGMSPGALAARMISAIAAPFETFDAGRLGMSVGGHCASHLGLAQMLSCADEALYEAKRTGRNRFRLFDDGLSHRLTVRRDGERDLSQALAEGGLEVWFQPIFGSDGRTLAGLEALLRWRHPQHGWLPPTDVVAAAATAGLAVSLLRFVLGRTCAMMRILREHGLDHVRVAMNVSPREMSQVAVDEIVLDQLLAIGLPAPMLEIEITEETALDIAAVQSKLHALAEAGVRLAVDDFGSGYSSLASLRHLRAQRVKVDRGLVTGLSTSEDKKVLVQAAIGLGSALGLEVVAEGVETAEDLAALQALGCRFLQGYHLGRPMPERQILEMLTGWRALAA